MTTCDFVCYHLTTQWWVQATFEDSLAEEAEAKRHCTTSEAVQAGAQAGAYRTLLTHFSQRYPKIPVVDQNFQVRHHGAHQMQAACVMCLGRHALPKGAALKEEGLPGGALQGTVGIAFDLMSVNLADVTRLPHIVPALKLLFIEHEQQDEEDAEPLPQMLT